MFVTATAARIGIYRMPFILFLDKFIPFQNIICFILSLSTSQFLNNKYWLHGFNKNIFTKLVKSHLKMSQKHKINLLTI